jgi:phospholipase/carboxylesterase
MKHVWIKGSIDHTLVMLHGTGGNEYDLIDIAKMIDPNANILSIRGNVLESGMPRFFKRIAPGVFDLDSLVDETKNLYHFLKQSEELYNIKRENMIVIGYSNGANIAGSILLHEDHPFNSAVLLRPMLPLKKNEINDLSGVHIFIIASKLDPIVKEEETQELGKMLRLRGAHSTMTWVESGHQLTMKDIELMKAWYESKVKRDI